jgi:phosphoglycolate/pyridoxal phosphate phosphatase family enzyme
MEYKTYRLKDIDLFVLDMDGTIYLGEQVFPEALRFVKEAREAGKRVIFFTNNASRNPQIYVERLNRMGFEASREDILSSGDVTAAYLNLHHKGEPVYLVGTPALEEMFRDEGINLTNGSDRKTAEKASIVVASFDTTLTYEKLDIACNLIRKGATFYSTHPDFVCPLEGGAVLPDSGAICALLTSCTGVTPKYFGKPEKETALMLERSYNVPPERTAIVGDRLYTDIALGKNNGLLSILVLTGETTMEDVNESNAPDVILNNIGEILDYLY